MPDGRVDRLDLVARVLSDRPGITAPELARELGVSVRSVFRDVAALRARGYPVEADRGRGGGLRLHRNWGLGRVLLSREEALGALLGLAVAERLGMPMFTAELGRARRRVVDAFPTIERRRLAPLRERILVGDAASADVRRSYGEPSPAAMRPLQAAFVDAQLVRAVYAREDGAQSTRRLEPHALLVTWPAWYLLAYDHLREAARAFRLDRFVRVEREPETFRPDAHAIAQTLLTPSGLTLARL